MIEGSPGRDLNPRPRPYQGRAIPLSHRGALSFINFNIATGPEGFEPSTSGLEARRYIQAKPRAQCGTPRCFVHLKSFVNHSTYAGNLQSLKIKNISAYPRGNLAAASIKIYTPSLFFKELPEMGKLKIFLEGIKMHETFWFQY